MWLICAARAPVAHGESRAETGIPVPRVLILWNAAAAGEDSVDQCALEEIFGVTGLPPGRVEPAGAERALASPWSVLIVPHASSARMSGVEARRIVGHLARGGTLVTDGPGPLARALGVGTGDTVRISQVTDLLHPHPGIRWSDGAAARVITRCPRRCATVFEEARTHRPLAVVFRRGRGRCLFIAPLVDVTTAGGYSRFPTLPRTITSALGLRPLFSRRAAEAYFDPGYRFGTAPDSLARMWRAWGIRCVHVSAWYASSTPPFDYRALLTALHGQGILAYAWLEWPYVGQGFWDGHPGWRQKNALLQDAHLDFLYLMDLQNPACMAAALDELESLLRLDWDGVDVAEFTLTGAGREALEGPAIPAYFTGFTDVGREGFARKTGFDPIELFNPGSRHYWKTDTAGLRQFYRYRTAVNVATERALFSRLRGLPGGTGELVLTIVDNSLHPEFDDLLGFSMSETVALLREFDVTLMVEDPYPEWSTPPWRYRGIRSHYGTLLGGRPFLIDVNVVPMAEDRKGLFATEQPTGTEFLELWEHASGGGERVCYYSESSVYAHDWRLLPWTMAAGARAANTGETVTVDAPRTVMLRAGGVRVLMDGTEWPARSDSEIIIPAGRHVLSTGPRRGGAEGALRLTSITGELVAARLSGDSLVIDYRAAGRCALGFNAVPRAFMLDGAGISPPVYHTVPGCEVYLAGGEHRCTVLLPGGGGHSPEVSPAGPGRRKR